MVSLRQQVNEGSTLADALTKHSKVFQPLFINMVRSGEAAGNLDEVLGRLADFLENQAELKSKVVGAMTYPIIMMVVGSGVMLLLMTKVVPEIVTVFEDMERQLPWNTELLIVLSRIVSDYWWGVMLLGVVAFLGFQKWRSTPKGRGIFDKFQLRAWLLGPMIRNLAVARLARTLATMLASGVPVLSALDIVKKVVNNAVLEKVIDKAREAVREGDSLANTLRKSKEFPTMMCHMVAVGERSGELESMLNNVASAYEREVDAKVARFTAILSPLMIVVMAVVVGFVVFSVMMPIMDMGNIAE